MVARLDVLTEGYAGDRVAGTVVLLRDGDLIAVVDPGMVADRARITDPLLGHGVTPDEVTDVIFSHHHPDHTVNAALFPNARVHDFQAIYQDDVWADRQFDLGPELSSLSPSVRLLLTPGHTPQDVTTLVDVDAGMVACTHLWWSENGPADDPFAGDRALLTASREKVLALDPVSIVPGHGAPFSPGPATPR
jgi:glyoxylase-like metal-dependent hydrolase (beta-lactamase superfamily II)